MNLSIYCNYFKKIPFDPVWCNTRDLLTQRNKFLALKDFTDTLAFIEKDNIVKTCIIKIYCYTVDIFAQNKSFLSKETKVLEFFGDKNIKKQKYFVRLGSGPRSGRLEKVNPDLNTDNTYFSNLFHSLVATCRCPTPNLVETYWDSRKFPVRFNETETMVSEKILNHEEFELTIR